MEDTTNSKIIWWNGEIVAEETAIEVPCDTKVPLKVKGGGSFTRKIVSPCENLSVGR